MYDNDNDNYHDHVTVLDDDHVDDIGNDNDTEHDNNLHHDNDQ